MSNPRRGSTLLAPLLLSMTAACYHVVRVESRPTPPVRPLPDLPAELPADSVTFRNLTHPSVSPYWARGKVDGEAKVANVVTAQFRINWLPVLTAADGKPSEATRLAKQTVCGTVAESELFIGDDPTSEYDWNLVVSPRDPRFVDVDLLAANARRLKAFEVNLSFVFERSGKYSNTSFWHHDPSGRYLLEVEVTPPRALLASEKNPLPCAHQASPSACVLDNAPGVSRPQTQTLRGPRELCAYGPWVQEALHGFRPEIHPAEALYWQSEPGVWELLMLQDASRRFDASRSGAWWTVLGSPDSPQNAVAAEHWVQEAMIGEFTVPLDADGAPTVEVVGEEGLQRIGEGGYPEASVPGTAAPVTAPDPRLQAFVIGAAPSGRKTLIVRAQIRGASESAPLLNHGAYLHLRVRGASPAR